MAESQDIFQSRVVQDLEYVEEALLYLGQKAGIIGQARVRYLKILQKW